MVEGAYRVYCSLLILQGSWWRFFCHRFRKEIERGERSQGFEPVFQADCTIGENRQTRQLGRLPRVCRHSAYGELFERRVLFVDWRHLASHATDIRMCEYSFECVNIHSNIWIFIRIFRYSKTRIDMWILIRLFDYQSRYLTIRIRLNRNVLSNYVHGLINAYQIPDRWLLLLNIIFFSPKKIVKSQYTQKYFNCLVF